MFNGREDQEKKGASNTAKLSKENGGDTKELHLELAFDVANLAIG